MATSRAANKLVTPGVCNRACGSLQNTVQAVCQITAPRYAKLLRGRLGHADDDVDLAVLGQIAKD